MRSYNTDVETRYSLIFYQVTGQPSPVLYPVRGAITTTTHQHTVQLTSILLLMYSPSMKNGASLSKQLNKRLKHRNLMSTDDNVDGFLCTITNIGILLSSLYIITFIFRLICRRVALRCFPSITIVLLCVTAIVLLRFTGVV